MPSGIGCKNNNLWENIIPNRRKNKKPPALNQPVS